MGDGVGPAHEAVRSIGQELAGVGENKIAQILAMVDAMPSRGAADSLIAPLRPRLAQLKLARPLNFGRLLFVPLDTVLVHGPDWRRGSTGVPRTALQPMVTLVRNALQTDAAQIEARLRGQTASNAAVVLAEGRTLWPLAAPILAEARMPDGWQAATALGAVDFAPIAAAVAAVLAQATWIQEAVSGKAARPNEAVAVAHSLGELARTGPHAEVASGCLFAVLLATLPSAGARIDAIEGRVEPATKPAIRRARSQAHTFVLDRLEACSGLAGNLATAADSVQRDAQLLDDMTEQARSDPGQRARVQQVRRSMDDRCRARFESALKSDLVIPPVGPGAAARIDDEAMTALEQAARGLSRFGQSARRIGSRDFYEKALAAAAQQVTGPQAAGLSKVDRARVTELLLGTDAAIMLMKKLG